MDSVLDDMKHMDILHAARRLWKRRLTSCDLGNLEYAILGMERISDIPGEMIPQIYFEYIRKRQALLLRDVLEHNYHDITNMILLTLFVAAAVNDPFNTLEAEEDLYSLAKYLYQNNHFDETNSILTKLNDQCENPMIKKELLFLLSMTHKKRGDLDTSRIYFQKLLETQRDHPGALEELAKYYEHHEKNFPAALELINQGLEYDSLMTQLGKNSSLSIIKDDLYFRRARLERKLSRANQATET
jgi:tetratricopeptide (TPR) repeat protein